MRATPDIAFATCDQRVNLYASIQLPFTAQSRLGDKRKSSSVKEFWFDEELDSCQLGDNMFFEDFSGCWSTDTGTSTSDCEQRDDDNVGARRKHIGNTRKDVENNRRDVANARNVIGMDWEDIENDRKNIVDNQDVIGNNRNDAGNDKNNIAKARNDIVDVTEDDDNEELKLQEHVDYFDKNTERFETRVTNVNDIAEKWREMRNMRIYSSDTSTETEDECQIDYDNNRMTLDTNKSPDKEKIITYPPVVSSQRNYDLNCKYLLKKSVKTSGGLGISGNFIHDQAMDARIDITANNISKITAPNLPSDSTNSRCIGHDAICKDVIPNDVILKYVTRDVIDNAAWKSADSDRKAISITHSKVHNVWNTTLVGVDKKSKENVIDCDDLESSQCSNHEMDDGLKVATPLNTNNAASTWGSVLITGHVGADIHREIIPLCLSANTTQGISLHQMASKKLIDGMEALIDNSLPADSARLKREIFTLSKESRVPSSMTSTTTVDDSGNTVGVWQDTVGFTLR